MKFLALRLTRMENTIIALIECTKAHEANIVATEDGKVFIADDKSALLDSYEITGLSEGEIYDTLVAVSTGMTSDLDPVDIVPRSFRPIETVEDFRLMMKLTENQKLENMIRAIEPTVETLVNDFLIPDLRDAGKEYTGAPITPFFTVRDENLVLVLHTEEESGCESKWTLDLETDDDVQIVAKVEEIFNEHYDQIFRDYCSSHEHDE